MGIAVPIKDEESELHFSGESDQPAITLFWMVKVFQ